MVNYVIPPGAKLYIQEVEGGAYLEIIHGGDVINPGRGNHDRMKRLDIDEHMAEVRKGIREFAARAQKQATIEEQPSVKPTHKRRSRDWEQRNRKTRR